MQPIETTDIGLEFVGPLAAGWLFLALPAAIALLWLMYRRQFAQLSGTSKVCLFAMRAVIILLLVLMIFRPVFVLRNILTYPGRVFFVVDDSESMAVADNRLNPADAVHIARRLAIIDEADDADRDFFEFGEALRKNIRDMREFESYSRRADRSRSEYWERADEVQSAMRGRLEAYVSLVKEIAELEQGDEQPVVERELGSGARELQDYADTLFVGERHPGEDRFETYYERAQDLRLRARRLQAGYDSEYYDDPEHTLGRVLREVTSMERRELLQRKVTTVADDLSDLDGRQIVGFTGLFSDDMLDLRRYLDAGMPSVYGETRIAARLRELVEEESRFPLTAIVLLSDGQELGDGGCYERLISESARRRIPVFTGGIGGLREPYDVAVIDVSAPEVAVKGREVVIGAELKTILPEPREMNVALVRDGERLSEDSFTLGESDSKTVNLKFTPQEADIGRYSIEVAGAPGEAVPARNNRQEFAVNVRTDPVRVLLLEWEPRWETRFIISVLGYLDFVELNPIVALAQPDAVVRRGVGRMRWPEDYETLSGYDVVILGYLPHGLLDEGEMDDLRTFAAQGNTICFLAPDDGAAAILAEELIPVGELPARLRDPGISLTAAGDFHPATRLLESGGVPPELRISGMTPDAKLLIVEMERGLPLVFGRLVDDGRAFYVGYEELWRINPLQYNEHRMFYTEMLRWAIESAVFGGAENEDEGVRIGIDSRLYDNLRGVQVWVYNAGEREVSVLAYEYEGDGTPVFEETAQEAFEGASIKRAEFRRWPSEDGEFPSYVYFTLDGDGEISTSPLVFLERYRELNYLARNEVFLQALAGDTGGVYAGFEDVEDFVRQLDEKSRIEEEERRWRMWNSLWILTLIAALFTVQWVWRKFAGLI